MVHLTQTQFQTAIDKGIYSLIENKGGEIYKVKYHSASLRPEYDKIQDVKVFQQ